MKQKLLTLVALLLIGVSGAVGDTFDEAKSPSQNTYTKDGITISGTKANLNFTSSGKQDCYTTNSTSSVFIYSELTNINSISFDVVRNSNGNSKSSALNLLTSTGGAFAVPTSGFTATSDGASLTSLSAIAAIGNNQASATTISVTFTSAVKAIILNQTNSSAIRNIVVTYDKGTLPSTYFAAHISGNDEATIDTNPGGASSTVDTNGTTSVSINSTSFYKLDSNGVTIDLGTGNTFEVGDQIVVETAGGSNNKNSGLKIQKSNGTDVVAFSGDKITNVFSVKYFYVVKSGDGIAGAQSVKFVSTSTDSRYYSYAVLRASSPATAYTVSFNAGAHGTYTGGDIAEASAGAGITLPSLTTLATGYTFNGWYTASTGGTKAGDAGATYKPADDIELFAQYSANTYTVTLDDNGGTEDGTATATYDSNTLTGITAPTKAGSSVVGYYKEEGCTTLVADAEGNLEANVEGFTGAGGIWTATTAKTLFAKWLTENDATFSDGSYTIGGAALDISTLFTSSSDGAVTYNIKNANGTGATIDGTSFTATTAGTATVTATQAATSTYAGASVDATITVIVNPVGNHTITYTLDVPTSSANSKKNTINSTNVSSSTYLNTLVGITNNTEGDYGTGDKVNLTVSIPTETTLNNAHYMSVGFTVSDGYKFIPSAIGAVSVKAQPISTAKSVKLVLTDGTVSIEKTQASLGAGSITEVTMNNDDEVAFTGDVTLKIYCYGATDKYRLGSPITISGEVVAEKALHTNAGGWTSYTPEWNATLSSGATAYIITDINSTSVTATPVTTLKAGEGYFINGTAGTDYTATSTTASATSTDGNLLVGRLSSIVINGDGYDKYVLGTNGSGEAGLFLVNSNVTVGAGKAYLQTNTSAAAPYLSIVWDDDQTTNINALDSRLTTLDKDKPMYNLAGQRVSESYKGVVIQNGKTYVRK